MATTTRTRRASNASKVAAARAAKPVDPNWVTLGCITGNSSHTTIAKTEERNEAIAAFAEEHNVAISDVRVEPGFFTFML